MDIKTSVGALLVALTLGAAYAWSPGNVSVLRPRAVDLPGDRQATNARSSDNVSAVNPRTSRSVSLRNSLRAQTDGPIIINGELDTPALLWVKDWTGVKFVALRSLDGGDVLAFIDAVVGPRPTMPELGPGGRMTPNGQYQKLGGAFGGTINVPQYSYSAAGDVINQTKAKLYETQVKAWQDHHATVIGMVQSIMLQQTAVKASH